MEELGPTEDPLGDLDIAGLETQSEVSEDYQHVTKFFHMLDRLVTVLRVYPKHHPVVANVAARCVERIAELLEGEGEIHIKLTPTEVLSEFDDVLFSREMSEAERFLWYGPHADGIWLFTFKHGLDVEELQKFMSVINQVATDEIYSDDDAVTLLWELQLEHIDYRAVDTFMDNETIEEFNGRTPKEMMDLLVQAAIEPESSAHDELAAMFEVIGIEGLDWFTNQRLEKSLSKEGDPIAREHLEYALSMDKDHLAKLYTEWHAGSNLEFRFVEALLSIIRSSPGDEIVEHVQEIIEKMTLQMIEREMFEPAERVLQLLKSRQDVFEHADNPLEQILEEISEPEVVEGLLWRMQRSEEQKDQLISLLGHLYREVVESRCFNMLSGDNELPDAGSVVDLLFDLAKTDSVSHRLDESVVERERLIERVLPELEGRDLDAWPPAKQVISAALRSENDDLIRPALDLEGQFWTDLRLVETALAPLVSHPEEMTRRRVFGKLSKYRPRMFEERILELVSEGEFSGKSNGELRFLFRTFAEQQTDARETLIACISDHRGWLGSAGRRAAEAAADVLIKRGDNEAIDLARERANSILTAPKLKEGLRGVLTSNGLAIDSDASEGTDAGGDQNETTAVDRENLKPKTSGSSAKKASGAQPDVSAPPEPDLSFGATEASEALAHGSSTSEESDPERSFGSEPSKGNASDDTEES